MNTAGSEHLGDENMYGQRQAPNGIAWSCHGQQTWGVLNDGESETGRNWQTYSRNNLSNPDFLSPC